MDALSDNGLTSLLEKQTKTGNAQQISTQASGSWP